MRPLCLVLTACFLNMWALSAQQPSTPRRERLKQSCGGCHSLRIIETQRLSREIWSGEIDKMERWGASIENRDALLDYLATEFGEDQPPPAPVMTDDGRRQER